MRTILFIIRKEIQQVLRDRILLLQIFIPPLLQLLILSQAMTFEVKQVDLSVVDLDRSAASERLIEQFTASSRFEVALYTASGDRAARSLLTRESNAILRIPSGFESDLNGGVGPTVQLIVNAEDGAAAGIIQSYAARIVADYSTESMGISGNARPVSTVRSSRPSVAIHTRTFYNPEGAFLGYMAIGLLASLVTLVGILITSQNIAREKEIGTLEQLNVTPITRAEFIAGKLIPFWILGLIELTMGLVIIRFVFSIPFEGSLPVVYAGAAVYLIAALGLGLLISTVVQTQQQAQFITFFVLVTFFFLGGIFTPVQSMPGWAQDVAELNPIKHFVEILRSVLMKGAGFADLTREFAAMGAFGLAALGLALFRYSKTAS